MKRPNFVFTVLFFNLFTLIGQDSFAQTSKEDVITIKSSDDLKALQDIYQQKFAAQLQAQQTEEDETAKVLKEMEEAYNEEIKELDAIEKEKEAIVNWYFSQPSDLPQTPNTVELSKKNK